LSAVKKFMNDYISDPARQGDDVCFDNKEVNFLLLLQSTNNIVGLVHGVW